MEKFHVIIHRSGFGFSPATVIFHSINEFFLSKERKNLEGFSDSPWFGLSVFSNPVFSSHAVLGS